MQKVFTFLFSLLLVSTLFAQKKEAVLVCSKLKPEIGDEIDELWEDIDENPILLPFKNETPTLGNDGDTWWKGFWVINEGIYLLAYVTDDDYYPYYAAPEGSVENRYDQIEWYIDCNYFKEDGIGVSPEGNEGHYQIAPAVPDGGDDGTMYEDFQPGSGIQYAYNASQAPNWWQEVFIPFDWLKDKDGLMVDIGADVGFDVTVVDGDRPINDASQRAVWANDGNSFGLDESLNNMDGAGLIYFGSCCCLVYADSIKLTGGSVAKDNEPFQIGIELFPEETTDKTLKWIIHPESTAKATISSDGIVTPISDGVLYVTATMYNDYIVSNNGEPIIINISGQRTTVHEVNYIIDGYNNEPQVNNRPNAAWLTEDGYGTHTCGVENGGFHVNSDAVLSTSYAMVMRQSINKARILPKKDVEFIAAWKMWAAEETSFQLVLEQRRSWSSWGDNSATSTPDVITPVSGETRWDIMVYPEENWYRISFTPNQLASDQLYDFSFQVGLTNTDIYMDSLYLIEAADFEIIDWTTSIKQNKYLDKISVYPNPANDILHVTLDKGNTDVSIYNSVGAKMEEIFVEGTHHVFNVSNYSPGLYFVKANNTVVKFVK